MRLLSATVALAVLAVGGGLDPAGAQDDAATLCSPAEVRRTISRFLAAFNAGDGLRLDRVFAGEPDFRWYSTDAPGKRFLPVAANRSGLVRYFARRHLAGERLRLRSVKVNGNTEAAPKPYGNFEFRLVRRARELPPTDYGGKGALHCYASRPDELIVWSMARER